MKFDPAWILYEDNHLFVFAKPPGLLAQEDQSGDDDVLTIVKEFIKERDHKPGQVFLGLVHRLDRNTGGVFCLAKTSKAAARLSEQIRNREWSKNYLAITLAETDAPLEDGSWRVWEDYLRKDEEFNRSRIGRGAGDGKAARLRQRVLAAEPIQNHKLKLREVDLESGRSHQIRVQSSSHGEPVLGDYKYAAPPLPGVSSSFLGLWAWRLDITHPVKGERMRFYSMPPESYPWSLFTFAIQQARAQAEAETRPLA